MRRNLDFRGLVVHFGITRREDKLGDGSVMRDSGEAQTDVRLSIGGLRQRINNILGDLEIRLERSSCTL